MLRFMRQVPYIVPSDKGEWCPLENAEISMPKGPQGQKRPADVIARAVMVARIATGEIEELLPELSGRVRSGKGRRRSARLKTIE